MAVEEAEADTGDAEGAPMTRGAARKDESAGFKVQGWASRMNGGAGWVWEDGAGWGKV